MAFTVWSLQELEQGVPVAQRVRAMKELHEIVATKHLEEVQDSSSSLAISI